MKILVGIIGGFLLFMCTMIDLRGASSIPWCDGLVESNTPQKWMIERRYTKTFCIEGQITNKQMLNL